jgi:leucyl aminopeptidase
MKKKKGINPTPSIAASSRVEINVTRAVPARATAIGVPVGEFGQVAPQIGLDRRALKAAGFDGKVGQTLVLPQRNRKVVIAVGVGNPRGELTAAALRDAAAAFARAAGGHGQLATTLNQWPGVDSELAAQTIVEGVLLARYRFDAFRDEPSGTPLSDLTLVAATDRSADVTKGAERGHVTAAATQLARDLANTPHNHLTATRLAEIAAAVGKKAGLGVEVFDKEALVEMGCGGLLGVNAGSAEPPRMIKLTYSPKRRPGKAVEPAGHLAFVGKGIMYDSGGIALKPGDEVHAQMKNDMSGAAAILAAMSSLARLGCTSAVTGYLMCTDNMPSGTAMALGDVITMRGGTTVEVINSDAEGRLVMADALVLSTEEQVDAIVDIATLTGACMRALGRKYAGVMGNNEGLVEQVRAAGETTDELVWPFPLERSYRKELNSRVADIRNMGGPLAGQITAGLFLEEFVGGRPWAHIDIAGTAWTDADAGWLTAGCSGFGARLLIELALNFTPPKS